MIGTQDLNRLEGATVYDESGDKIGKVEQIYLDDTSQDPAWVTVNTGFFGTSETFIPLQAADFSGDDLRVPYAKDKVKDAPRVESDQHISREEEQELYRYYGLTETSGTTTGTTGTAGEHRGVTEGVDTGVDTGVESRATGDEASVTLSEEQLEVQKHAQETGRVRLRKYTTTDTKQVEVPVTKERLRVEREPASGTATAGAIGDDDQVEEITLREEQVNVQKEAVPVEEVSIAKEQVTEHETVSEDVRKEHADLDLDGSAEHDRGTGSAL